MRKLMLFAVGFGLAAAVFAYFLFDKSILWIAAVCLILSPLCLYLRLDRCSVVLLGVVTGLIWCFAYGQIWLGPAERAWGTEQIVSAEVLDHPHVTDYGARATVEIALEDRSYRAVLYRQEDLLEATPGDKIQCIAQIESSLLDDKKDLRFYHRSAGVVLLLYGQSEVIIEPGEPTWYIRLQMWFQNRITMLYDGDVRSLMNALLTGDQGELSDQLRNDLSVAGLSHAVAVSGLHVAVLLSALALLCGYNPRLMALLGIPLSVIFVLMTGASPSACRAAVMQILMLLAPLVRRENDPWTSLSAAALLLLMENPWVITSVSFQLSFSAVAGLLLFSVPIQKRLLALRKKTGEIWHFVVSGVSASLSATIATLPLTVYYFGMVSICAVLTNLLCLWAMTGMLILGMLSCLAGGIGMIFALPVSVLGQYVITFVETVAKFPYAAAYIQNIPLMIWAVCAYGAGVFLLIKRKVPVLLPVIGLTIGFLGCILWGNWHFTHDMPVYRVLDVGQGQCIMVETEEVTAVVDCGGSYPQAVGEQAARTLQSAGKSRVDLLILTHYDKDHAGGAVQLLHRMDVGLVIIPNLPDGGGIRQAIEEKAAEEGTAVLEVATLTEIAFSDGKITVYPPLSDDLDDNAGICVLATAAEYDMLVTGDLDMLAELRLMSHYALPQVEVLVAGHHGAQTSTGETLLKRVCPKLVVISAGKDNPYGHPAKETLERITKTGAETVCTADAGTIVLRR